MDPAGEGQPRGHPALLPRHRLEPFSPSQPRARSQPRRWPPAPAGAGQCVLEDPALARPQRAHPLPAPTSAGGVRPAQPHAPSAPRSEAASRPPLHAPPCARGLQAPAPLPIAPLCVVAPRDQRTGISVTFIYIKQWNKHRAWCPAWEGQGDAVPPPAAGGLRLGAGGSSPCSVPPALRACSPSASQHHALGSCGPGSPRPALPRAVPGLSPVASSWAEPCQGRLPTSASSRELPPGCDTNWAPAGGTEPAWDSREVKARHLNEV